MAFVSDQHHLVFVHVTKNGGTSISEALTRAHGYHLYGDPGIYRHEGIGLGIPRRFRPAGIDVHETIRGIRQRIDTHGYRSFAVVRNPWARIYSFYEHKRRRGDEDLPEGTFADVLRQSNVLLLQPQMYWLRDDDGELGVDHVLRFENLGEEFGALMRELGIDATLSHLNRGQGCDHRPHYDDYSRELVYDVYRHEIERFGYRF